MSEKTIADQFADALAQVASLSADLKAANELTEQAQGQLAAKDAQLSELSGKLEAANGLIATGNAALADLAAKLTAAETAKADAEKQAANLKNAVEKNPAFAHAAAGRKPVEDVGSDPGSGANLVEQLSAISDPTERTRFRVKHYDALMAQSRNNLKG
jgi:ABC-type transporter Mla subunit MlaD